MNTKTKNLNEQITLLVSMLEEQANTVGADNDMSFIPALIQSAQSMAANNALSEEELSYSEETEAKTTLTDQLADFQRKVSSAYNFLYPKQDRPDWMKIGNNKYENFFPQFFIQVEQDSTLIEFLTHNGTDVANMKSVLSEWQKILQIESKQQELFHKVERMADLKNLLIAALRMYKLSTFEIKAALV